MEISTSNLQINQSTSASQHISPPTSQSRSTQCTQHTKAMHPRFTTHGTGGQASEAEFAHWSLSLPFTSCMFASSSCALLLPSHCVVLLLPFPFLCFPVSSRGLLTARGSNCCTPSCTHHSLSRTPLTRQKVPAQLGRTKREAEKKSDNQTQWSTAQPQNGGSLSSSIARTW
jgi:hypothetical protein